MIKNISLYYLDNSVFNDLFYLNWAYYTVLPVEFLN